MTAGAAASMGSDTGSSSGTVGVSWVSVSSSGAEAATWLIRACSKAGSATIDNSVQRPASTTMVPDLSNENLVGTTPTLTLS